MDPKFLMMGYGALGKKENELEGNVLVFELYRL